MSLQNPNNVVTEERLAEFYQQILPYLGGMPDVLANKFNRADLYSTDEKLIGRWIDGKPLYQKVYDLGADTTISNSSWTNVNISGTNIGNVVSATSVADTDSRYFPLDVAKINGTLQFLAARANGAIDIRYITLKYTKTTDSAVEIGSDTDYSTTEKIVGTWIDGKPIWQKTITGLNINSMIWNGQYYAYAFIPKLVENVDTIINHVFYDHTNEVCVHGDLREQNDPNRWQIITNEASWVIDTITIQYTKTSS